MSRIEPLSCEPLRVWSRLEPRSREVEFEHALSAPVHDPLWMLARQWQFGEFHGEDTGSAVIATLARRLTPVVGLQPLGRGADQRPLPPAPAEVSLPAEARVEALPIDFPPLVRAQLGRTFLLHLSDAISAAPPADPALDADAVGELFRRAFPIRLDPPPGDDDPVATARWRASGRARRALAALAGRSVDGVSVFEAVRDGATWERLPDALRNGIDPAGRDLVVRALQSYRAWFSELYRDAPGYGAWDHEKLEYRAAAVVPRRGGAFELTVDGHVDGKLDWYAFDQGNAVPGAASSTTTRIWSAIPTPAQFPGMPNPRWWRFEDAAVDLGNIHASRTDVPLIVVAEFAQLFGNDWLVVPFRQEVGTLTEIEGIVVTDVFGWKTLVSAPPPASAGRWTAWDLFSLSPRGPAEQAAALPHHLFLPPTLGTVLDAQPREAVALVRDESANLAWGIETRVPDGLGGGRDGAEAAQRFRQALDAIVPVPPPPADGPALRYRLGAPMAEHWIPFVPVHLPGSTRATRLQVASMPRVVGGSATEDKVRPRTSILRHGLQDDDARTEASFLDEEEIPRAGVVVRGGLRRARWLGGATLVWHARTVSSGRGEVDGGLRFDVVERNDPGAGPG